MMVTWWNDFGGGGGKCGGNTVMSPSLVLSWRAFSLDGMIPCIVAEQSSIYKPRRRTLPKIKSAAACSEYSYPKKNA